MNKEIKKIWVQALRSGIYEKTTGKLHKVNEDDDQRFCCLGVLCDIAAMDGVLGEYIEEDPTEPSAAVRIWAGMDDMKIMYKDEQHPIYRLNDHYALSFNQIANIIEAQL